MILGAGFVIAPPPEPDAEGFYAIGAAPSQPEPLLVTSGVRFVARLVRESRATGQPLRLTFDDVLAHWEAGGLTRRDPSFTEIFRAYGSILAQTLAHRLDDVPFSSQALAEHVHAGIWAESILLRSYHFSETSTAVYVALLSSQ